jgi:hypothetical protein
VTIRFAALDLDGTLINAADQPFEGVLTGLATLRERGVLPIVITGRAAGSFRHLGHLRDLFALADDEVLLSEGNVRLARTAGALTYLRTCPHGVLRRLATAPGTHLVAEWAGEFHATTARAAAQFAFAYRVPRQQIPVTGAAVPSRARPTAVTVFGSRTPVPELVAGFGCVVAPVGPFGAQVIRPRGTSKVDALARHLWRRFGETDLSRTLAIGDGASDAAMLGACAISVAPRGADEAAIAAADRHLDGELAAFLHDFHPERS